MSFMRIDQLLVERGLAASRSQAQRLIAAGVQWRVGAAWQSVGKNGDEVPVHAELQLLDAAEARYVSRGGLKLAGALATAGLEVRGWRCLDIGQSTGGFTDCLLQQGATHVTGVDVGQNQLHPRLRSDARVICIEKCNARHLNAAAVGLGDGEGFDLAVGDVSFISLTLILPAVLPLLKTGGALLLLVKPQFELQPEHIGKGGVVRDAQHYGDVKNRLFSACAALNLVVCGWYDSPITGGDGNREFFIFAQKSTQEPTQEQP